MSMHNRVKHHSSTGGSPALSDPCNSSGVHHTVERATAHERELLYETSGFPTQSVPRTSPPIPANGEHGLTGTDSYGYAPCESIPQPPDAPADLPQDSALPPEHGNQLDLGDEKMAQSDTFPAASPVTFVEATMHCAGGSELAEQRLVSCSRSVVRAQKQSPDVKSTSSQESPESEFRWCRSAGLYTKGGSAVSFLDAFHQRQRDQASSELKRRDEALHTLKQWRGHPKHSDAPVPQQRYAADAPAGAGQQASDPASRRRMVGEMAALFSSLCLTKQQRASASCRQTIAQLEQQHGQVTQLIQRLSLSASVAKARGALVKARSLQLQMQQQGQRSKGQNRRLPAHLLLPLPSFSTLCSEEEQKKQRDMDPWRRLVKRVRPVRRRASLPPSVRLGRSSSGILHGSVVASASAAAATRASPTTAAAAARTGRAEDAPPGTVGISAAVAESAVQDAVAAAVAADFSDAVDRFSSRQRTASMGWRAPQQISPMGQPLTTKEWASELLQQAEVVCCAAIADASGVGRASVMQALEILSRTLQIQVAKCQQRLKIAALMERRRTAREGSASVCRALQREASSSGRGWSCFEERRDCNARSESSLGGAEDTAAQREGWRQVPLHFSSGSAPLESRSDEAFPTPHSAAPRSKKNLTVHLDDEYGADDSNLLDAETDCEYLLGRQLLPYERMLLKYRMLRRNAYAGTSASRGETTETYLVEELLRAVEDRTTLPGDAGAVEDEADMWAFGGNKDENEAAKIEHLLGLVGELQQADLQQHNHVQQSLLSPRNSMPNEECMLRCFFQESRLPAESEFVAEVPRKAEVALASPTFDERETASDAGIGGESTDPELQSSEFPTAEKLYRAHYLLGPWRGSIYAIPPKKS